MDSVPKAGKAGLFLLGIRIFLAVIVRLLTAPLRWRRWDGPPTLLNDVSYAGIRTLLAHMTIAQARYMYPGTIDVYLELCRQQKKSPKYLTVEGVTSVYIGEKAEDADVVILYLHGGGYTQPCPLGHMQYLDRLVQDIAADDEIKKTMSVLLPAYTLTPEATYPTQLNEAATVLAHLLTHHKRDPASIIIAGDSAGGNLALSLVSHILHPRPSTPRVTLTTPLRGLILISPWVTFSTEHASFTHNAGRDSLHDATLRKWGAMHIGATKDESPIGQETINTATGLDSYNQPLRSEYAWWSGMHRVVADVFLWMGEEEVFVDGLKEFAALFRRGWENGGGDNAAMQVYVGPSQPHIGPIMDVLMQVPQKSKSQVDLEIWVNARLA